MRTRRQLRPEAEPDALATAPLASIEGGLLLSRTRRDIASLRTALDAAPAHLRSSVVPDLLTPTRTPASSTEVPLTAAQLADIDGLLKLTVSPSLRLSVSPSLRLDPWPIYRTRDSLETTIWR
jgi:hypothetical protein